MGDSGGAKPRPVVVMTPAVRGAPAAVAGPEASEPMAAAPTMAPRIQIMNTKTCVATPMSQGGKPVIGQLSTF